MNDIQTNITHNLQWIHDRIDKACAASGREKNSVRLLMATKTVLPENIRIAINAGETLVGENKVQEFVQKTPLLTDLDYERHFIGHLQTNKIKDILKYVSCIQSMDRFDLAKKLEERLQFEGKSLNIFVQVNTSFEESKFGLSPENAEAFLKEIKPFETLKVKGFMTIGLFDAEAEKVRPSFIRLREIRDNAIDKGLISEDATELSMGMSGDLEVAIAEGATIVRVGTAIFGQRIYPDSFYWNETK